MNLIKNFLTDLLPSLILIVLVAYVTFCPDAFETPFNYLVGKVR